MTNKHNKKRNIGIIYELMLRHISNAFIENDKAKIKKATNIIERRFAKNTELFKEFRLFSGLSRSKITSTEVAAVILSEAKNHVKNINLKKLEKEKSDLIREINYTIVPSDPDFYYRNIENYSNYANIQKTINEWKKGDRSSFTNVIKLEEKVINFLLEDKSVKSPEEQLKNLQESNSDKLVYKIMTEKINKKYNHLSHRQKEIIKEYAFNINNKEKLMNVLEKEKKQCISLIEAFKKENSNNYLNNQIEEVKNKIIKLDTRNVDDKSISKFLTVVNLIEEIKN